MFEHKIYNILICKYFQKSRKQPTNYEFNNSTAANVEKELKQQNENSDTKNEGIQHIRAKFGESF
jgi:hypothetical protein